MNHDIDVNSRVVIADYNSMTTLQIARRNIDAQRARQAQEAQRPSRSGSKSLPNSMPREYIWKDTFAGRVSETEPSTPTTPRNVRMVDAATQCPEPKTKKQLAEEAHREAQIPKDGDDAYVLHLKSQGKMPVVKPEHRTFLRGLGRMFRFAPSIIRFHLLNPKSAHSSGCKQPKVID